MTSAAKYRHLRPVKPLAFPAFDPEWEMGESTRHGRLAIFCSSSFAAHAATHGAPELCVEIVSPRDAEKLTWEEKLARYLALGVMEVIAFNPDAAAGERLRAWDRIDGDLVERVVEEESTPCDRSASTG